MITVIAKLPIMEGKLEEALGEFKILMSKVATEDGTVLYSLNKEKSNPNTLVVVEHTGMKMLSIFIHQHLILKNFLQKVSHLSQGSRKSS